MINPIKAVREEHSLTQRAFASLAGVTEAIVIRAESGQFGSLPPSIVRAVQQFTGQSNLRITADYEEWVLEELATVKLPPKESDKLILNRIDFIVWRAAVCKLNGMPDTVGGFCRLFKMHPYVIEKWESGRLKSAPLQLVHRLAHMRGIV